MKTCPRCKQTQPVTEFHRHKNRADGLQAHCKSCNKAESKRRYRLEPNRYQRDRKRQTERNLALIVEYLSEHPCTDCGITDIEVLEFDHLRDKDRPVSLLARCRVSVARLEAEIAKCEVVCANCHRKRTRARLRVSSPTDP